jgi:hypothetical protein
MFERLPNPLEQPDCRGERWAWEISDDSRWVQEELEDLKRELSRRAGLSGDRLFERCADAIGSLQFDLIDAKEEGLLEVHALEASNRALMKMFREKQDAMEVLLERLAKAGVDCSDLFS